MDLTLATELVFVGAVAASIVTFTMGVLVMTFAGRS